MKELSGCGTQLSRYPDQAFRNAKRQTKKTANNGGFLEVLLGVSGSLRRGLVCR